MLKLIRGDMVSLTLAMLFITSHHRLFISLFLSTRSEKASNETRESNETKHTHDSRIKSCYKFKNWRYKKEKVDSTKVVKHIMHDEIMCNKTEAVVNTII
jgi:hypothetical protein